MDIEFKGGNCVVLTSKKTTIVVDPRLSELGLRDQGQKATVQLLTQSHFLAPADDGVIIIDGPGEYEVQNVSIKGIPARAHLDSKGEQLSATIYRVDMTDASIAIMGHIDSDLSDDQLEAIGPVDIVVVPVGNSGYTLDATSAIRVIRAINPKAVIPTHYAEDGIEYPVPQVGLDVFLNELGAPIEETPKVKVKFGALPDMFVVYNVKRTA